DGGGGGGEGGGGTAAAACRRRSWAVMRSPTAVGHGAGGGGTGPRCSTICRGVGRSDGCLARHGSTTSRTVGGSGLRSTVVWATLYSVWGVDVPAKGRRPVAAVNNRDRKSVV